MEKTETLLDPPVGGCFSLYSGKTSRGTVPRFVVTLTMHVDRQILEDAANDVMVLFPHLRVRLSSLSSGYSFVRDESRIHVYQGVNGGGTIGGREDDCLFRISCAFKTVCFDVHASLLDEKGMAAFAKSVIFRYIQLSGYEVENDGSVRGMKDGVTRISEDDPFGAIEDFPASRPAWYMDAKAFHIPGAENVSGHFRAVQIRIPLTRLRSCAKDYADVPETFISPIVSHAIHQEYGDRIGRGEYVVAALSVNLRRFFPTLSLKPFSVDISLAYNRKFGDYPFNTILMSQKKFIEAQLKPDALAYNAERLVRDSESLMSGKDMAGKKSLAADLAERKAGAATYILHSAGTVGMPASMMRYVTEFYPMYAPSVHQFVLSSIIFRNELVLTATSGPGIPSGLCRRIVSLMNEHDIYAFISDEFDYVPVKYEPL